MRVLVYLLPMMALAQSPVEYRIHRAPSPITIDAKLDEPAWRFAPATSDFIFNWHTSGEKEPTEAKLLWDDENLYVSWRCTDRHISAYETKRHGPVSKDDCVEIFLSPNPAAPRNYYTFEINAIGTMLNRCRTAWWTGPPTWEPEGVAYRTTYHGLARKDESPDDREWIVELAIPLSNFSRDAAHTPPRDGDEWRINLMRTGGKTNMQQSTWSPIAASGPRSFHTPENFGKVVFSAQVASRRTAGVQARSLEGAEEGRVIYNRSCTMCHGLDGAAGDRAPALGAQRRYLRRTQQELYDAIRNGIKGTLMPGSPLPDADIRKMIAYIFSIRASAADVPVAGNPVAGEQIFHGKGGCRQCHMIRGQGGLIGPDLTNIAAERKLDELRAALVDAKPVPPRGYQPVSLTTKAGQSVRGVIKNENNFSLQILGTDDKLHLLDREEIRNITYETKSLMPSGIDRKLTATEFQDLLAFLSRQTRGNQETSRRARSAR
jgi:putative heme-binding domain-containing protein